MHLYPRPHKLMGAWFILLGRDRLDLYEDEMNNGFYISAVALLCSLSVSQQALASSDASSCPWGEAGCALESVPVLSTSNDSRDNLIRLLAEHNSIPLPLQPIPADLARNRKFYFGSHLDDWFVKQSDEQTEPPAPAPSPVNEPLKTLGLADQLARYSDADIDSLEDRFVSMTSESDANFFRALLAESNLSTEQQQGLAKEKIDPTSNNNGDNLTFPDGTVAQQFNQYLQAARFFYGGQYDKAEQLWTSLKDSAQPWLAETSSYMLMRNALNKSSQNAEGEYGYFDVEKIDRKAASEAMKWAGRYLQLWPEGQYAASTRGLLRRINWYLQDWDELARLYEQSLTMTKDANVLTALVREADSKLLSKDLTWDTDYFLNAPEAPLLTFVQTLRLMRNAECDPRRPCANNDYLAQIKPVFEKSNTLAYWEYLELEKHFLKEEYSAILAEIKPETMLPLHDILAFSRQVLYGEALMKLKQWDNAQQHWSKLLRASQDPEQQQFLQTELAATLVLSDKTEAIFAHDSLVTSLRYRSAVLKSSASTNLLRRQVTDGPNDEERTIALHSLLMRDLINAHYADWLADKKLVSHISRPVIDEHFSDVNLSVFDWSGEESEKGYFCRPLDETVTALRKNKSDGHALNCLGEFIRTTNAEINLWQDSGGDGPLTAVVTDGNTPTQPSRQDYYQTVMTDPKSEQEDKSYALYRAVMCYSPSGSNDCGGLEVEKLKRKGWFTQLQTQYPGSRWAQELQYYW